MKKRSGQDPAMTALKPGQKGFRNLNPEQDLVARTLNPQAGSSHPFLHSCQHDSGVPAVTLTE